MEKFRFDQLLRIKTQFEEIKKNELAKQNQILNEYIEKKLELEENIKKAREDLKSLCLNGFSPQQMKVYSQFLSMLKKRMDVQNQLIYYQQIRVEEKKKEVIESMIEKKRFEKLKEKYLINLMNEIKQLENKELDRVVSYKIYKGIGDRSGRD
ncbi:flagellar FliJ protein [Caldicellulosiruptor bescii]|jgi:flagellar FliJ protein|uniref:Flagellar FliJ protein n=2 Tax=Caldicellulosiruptor bescii TaxID=31899 RepID=B9MM21_CALBD|nr:flagellar export protein FliJ [Caldicellulosiruptor bescii]ACM61244.1 flagellar export protein FliJ [Caldicellulosiruptor bescii DSM 6725]PBC88943.1 flagellar FliJ protein [Caldicellulosiruptor bescii]PBC91575.1 flagellar FliJ protein [Caldicellulosiruptor bescii]PBD03012.1 flagellar FliJ protein [Caldicellulosiruptor bescii]PBD07373.1 flagellar FliJ protein [Caldicellulosiruptor bescii]